MSTAQQVHVQVGHRLPGVVADIHHESVPAREASLLGQPARYHKQMAYQGGMLLLQILHSGEGLARDYQEVGGGCGIDVADGEAAVVLEQDFCRQLAIGDLLEQRLFEHDCLGCQDKLAGRNRRNGARTHGFA